MAEFLELGDFAKFEAVHFAFDALKDPQIVLMSLPVLEHGPSNALDFLKAKPLEILASILFVLRLLSVALPTADDPRTSLPIIVDCGAV